jgi:CheY-like chemotaxis protein
MEKKILVADDSLTIQKVVELTFADSDYRLTCVSNGKLALESVRRDPPDLILADVVMPEKNGYEVCEEIKKNPATAGIPVLLLAGTFEPFDRERAERLKCDAIVSKPFDSHQLYRQVESLLANRQPAARPTGPIARDSMEESLEAPPVAVHPFPATPTAAFHEPAGFVEEDFTGSIRNLRGVGREEPLENLYGPEDVDSALAAFQAVEPNLWLEETPAAPPAPDAAPPAVESPEIPAVADGRTQRIDVSHFRAPAETAPAVRAKEPEPAPPARPPEPPTASLAAPPVTTPSGRELSEADIEAVAEKVARRVIEKLSERIVREIAWDVVPETAELAVRERIRELESGVE